MKWLEKNWLIVALVIGGYLWYNGTLGNLLTMGKTTTATPAAASPVIMGG